MITRRDFMKAGAALLAGSSAAEGAAPGAREPDSALRSPTAHPPEPSGPASAARWIWSSAAGLEPNHFVYFRRAFHLPAVPADKVNVKVSARTEYILYVNGRKLGFGPPIADACRYYFDLRDLQPFLRKGRNVIAARVYSLATATEDTKQVPGGFWLEGRVAQVPLDSDRRWKFFIPEVWQPDAPRQSFQLHYVEIADFRKEPAGWNGLEFDDAAWPQAVEMSGAAQSDISPLVQREMEDFTEVFLPASGALRTAEVERKTGFKIPALQVNAENFLPAETVKFQNLASLETRAPAASVATPTSGRDAALVLDMGKMVLGCPYLEVEGSAGTVVDVSISEYLEEGRVLASRAITPTERTNLTDRITLRQGKTAWQRNDYNGYRFLQLTIRGAAQPVILRQAGTVLRNYDFQHEATFRSSNPVLDRIFEGSKWSHRVNTHWGYCGSAWREHAQWSDLPWPACNFRVFHDPPLMRYFLRQVALGQNAAGRMQFPYPGSIGGELPEQTMWLADDLWNCALYFDDRELVRDLLPVMAKADAWFRRNLTARGLLTTRGWPHMWLVVDWGYPFVNDTVPGELATLNLIYYRFLRSVEKCAAYDGNQEARARFRQQAETLKQAINKVFGVPEQGLYFEKPDRQFPSQFASTLAVLYGVVPEEHLPKVFDFAVGLELRPGKASPWFMYEALEAFARAGRFADAVASICRYWGTFLDAGATTYWELWNIPGEDVHPLPGYTKEMGARTITYSSGPAPYAVAHILGVQPLAPGFRRMLIAPRPSGLDFFAGSAPTPHGDVRISYQLHRPENQTEIYVTIPEGANALLRLPRQPQQASLAMNGQTLFRQGRFQPQPAISEARAAANVLEFEIRPGNYYFQFRSGV